MNVRRHGDGRLATRVLADIACHVNRQIGFLGHPANDCRVHSQVAVVRERSNEVIIGAFRASRSRHTIHDRRIDGRIGGYHCRRRHIIPPGRTRHCKRGQAERDVIVDDPGDACRFLGNCSTIGVEIAVDASLDRRD